MPSSHIPDSRAMYGEGYAVALASDAATAEALTAVGMQGVAAQKRLNDMLAERYDPKYLALTYEIFAALLYNTDLAEPGGLLNDYAAAFSEHQPYGGYVPAAVTERIAAVRASGDFKKKSLKVLHYRRYGQADPSHEEWALVGLVKTADGKNYYAYLLAYWTTPLGVVPTINELINDYATGRMYAEQLGGLLKTLDQAFAAKQALHRRRLRVSLVICFVCLCPILGFGGPAIYPSLRTNAVWGVMSSSFILFAYATGLMAMTAHFDYDKWRRLDGRKRRPEEAIKELGAQIQALE